MWLAGGAVRAAKSTEPPTISVFKAIEKPTHVHDIHATILTCWESTIPNDLPVQRPCFPPHDVSGEVLHDLIA
jgi:hypothetical protein